MSTLAKYDQARQALAACRSVDEIKDIRDKSEAMRLYAKQAQDTELEQWAAEIKLRAQRAIGELSAALETQKGGFGIVPTGGKHKAEVLADAGISTSTANRYEKLAAIPEPVIEEIIAKSKDAGKPVSAKVVMATVAPKPAPRPPEPAPAPPAPTSTSRPTLVEQVEQQLAQAEAQRAEGAVAGDTLPQPDDAAEPDPHQQLLADFHAMQRERDALQERVQEVEALLALDDTASAADSWKMKFEQLSGRNRQLQQTARDAQTAEKRATDLLAKVRSVLGVEANADILPALTARRAA